MDASNPVGFLQEYCAKNCVAFPKYEEGSFTGADHCREFTCMCSFLEHSVEGHGNTKKGAKREAASAMVKLLTEVKYFKTPPPSFQAAQNGTSNAFQAEQNGRSNVEVGNKNAINILQEYFQKKQEALPVYRETAAISPNVGFACECVVDGKSTFGNGTTKKVAKNESALKMLQELNIAVNYDFAEREQTIAGLHNKNPISELMELCVRNNLPTPVFQEEYSVATVFVVTCSVGDHMAKGVGSNKQGAKTIAASKLCIILYDKGYGRSPAKTKWNPNSPCENVEVIDQAKLDEMLPDYDFNSGDDEGSVTTSIAALSMDDSLVEVEPTMNENPGQSTSDVTNSTEST